METENDTLVIKDSEGYFTTSNYRKPTFVHTLVSTFLIPHNTLNQLNAVLSRAKLYNRSKNIITKPLVISEEKKRYFTLCPHSQLEPCINFLKFAPYIYCKFDLYSTVTSIKQTQSPFGFPRWLILL